ncbi:MAG: hypothetical protein KIH08_10225, partial [Candidatus Freyarchaeota archaeon]|nr:hypothetical protein [Candidatus Jordarchaeia archaeon]
NAEDNSKPQSKDALQRLAPKTFYAQEKHPKHLHLSKKNHEGHVQSKHKKQLIAPLTERRTLKSLCFKGMELA